MGVGRRMGANLTLLLGDNFYNHGLRGDAEDTARRFNETFESVYAKLMPGQPFYAFAGNHDYGHGLPATISAQLEYTKRSAQWRYPALWYKIQRKFEAAGQARSLDVLVLDTIVLCTAAKCNDTCISEGLRSVEGLPTPTGNQSR